MAVARKDAVFEKIRLRNMSISKDVMRSKTFEAADQSNVVGPAGANRYVPQGARFDRKPAIIRQHPGPDELGSDPTGSAISHSLTMQPV
jgi:hypothetical protein